MTILAAALVASLALAAPRYVPAPNGGEERLDYLHDLASPTGKLELPGGALSWDPEARELFFAWGDDLRVFNEAGLEVHRFTELSTIGRILGVAPLPGGDLLLRVYRDGTSALVRADYRGRPLGGFPVTGLPAGTDVSQWSLQRAGDRLVFFDAGRVRVVLTTLEGVFVEAVELLDRPEFASVGEGDREVKGFAADEAGRLYFGFPMIFHVAVLDPDRALRGFGQKGSAAGKFNVIAGVAADEEGYVYVADILKGAVLVFNPLLKYVGQINGLTLPTSLLAAGGRFYVSQGGKDGVAVFQRRSR